MYSKGDAGQDALRQFKEAGVQYQSFVKYFGVKMGHTSVKEAFWGPLQEAYRRTGVASSRGLTIAEKVQLLEVWVLPTLLLTVRAYVAHWLVVSIVGQVYHVLFGFDSWGLTCHLLSQRRENGRYDLPLPETWLQAQGALTSVQFLSQPLRFPRNVRACRENFCVH